MKDTVINLENIFPLGQTIFEDVLMSNLTIRFTKLWESCSSHPHNKFLVFKAIVAGFGVQFVNWFSPVRWLNIIFFQNFLIILWILEFCFAVRFPCDVMNGHSHFSFVVRCALEVELK